MPDRRRVHIIAVLVLFIIYLVNGLIAIPQNSVTYDEMNHWSYGKRILKREPQKIYPYADGSAMPVTGLNAMPRAVEQVLNPELMKTDGGFSDIMHGRYVTLFICLLTGFFIYQWSKELFGENAGLFSLFLFVFCPNLNAHAGLLTTDAYTALATISSAYFFWCFIRYSGWKNFLLFSASLGVAQIVKYSLIHLFIVFFLVSIAILINRKTLWSHWKKNLVRALVLITIILAVINVAYLFQGTGKNMEQFIPYSKSFAGIKNSFIGKIPLPLPQSYIAGLDLTMHMNELGGGDPNVSGDNYLFGVKKTGEGFFYYYFAVFLFKTPITVLILFILSCVFLFRLNWSEKSMALWLNFILVFYFLFVLSIQNNVQIGIRHVLMIYPLIYVITGLLTSFSFFKKRKFILYPAIIIYSLAGFYFYFPNLLSYTNEFIPDKKFAYKIMADSNIDFGQGSFAAEKYLREHDDVMTAPEEPQTGKFILSVNDYLDLDNSHRFTWLSQIKPAKHIDHCFLLIVVTESDLK